MHTVGFGWANISRVNCVLSRPKFTTFFVKRTNNVGVSAVFACGCIHPFRKYSRPKFKIVGKSAFWTVLLFQALGAAVTPQMHPRCHASLATRHVVMFRVVTFSSACENSSRWRPLGAEIWSSEKVDLDVSESACPTVLLVNHRLSDFFRQTRDESLSITYMSFRFLIYPSVKEMFEIEY